MNRLSKNTACLLGAVAFGGGACVQILGDDFELSTTATGTASGAGDGGQGATSAGAQPGGGSPDGTPCSEPAECQSGLCEDGRCCDVACDGPCVACDLVETAGACTPQPAGADPEGGCAPGVCDGVSMCAEGRHLWSNGYDPGAGSEMTIQSLGVDAAGNVLFTGLLYDPVNFGDGDVSGPGSTSFYLVKLNADGVHQWSDAYSGSSSEAYVSGLGVDSAGNAAVTGSFSGTLVLDAFNSHTADGSSDFYVARFFDSGQVDWSHRFGDGNDSSFPADVGVDAAGNVVTAGVLVGTLDVGGPGSLASAGSRDVFVVKFDVDGVHQWSQRFGDTDSQTVHAVAVDGAGGIALAGTFTGTFDFGGPSLSGNNALFVAKLDADGGHLWSHAFSSCDVDDVTVDAQGNVVVTGRVSGSVDFGGGPLISDVSDHYLVKFGADGQHLHSQMFAADGGSPYGLAADPSGNVVLTGELGNSLDLGGAQLTGDGDVFFAKFSPAGQYIWSHAYNLVGMQEGRVAAAGPEHSLVFAGTYAGPLNLGGGALSGKAQASVFVAKLSP